MIDDGPVCIWLWGGGGGGGGTNNRRPLGLSSTPFYQNSILTKILKGFSSRDRPCDIQVIPQKKKRVFTCRGKLSHCSAADGSPGYSCKFPWNSAPFVHSMQPDSGKPGTAWGWGPGPGWSPRSPWPGVAWSESDSLVVGLNVRIWSTTSVKSLYSTEWFTFERTQLVKKWSAEHRNLQWIKNFKMPI